MRNQPALTLTDAHLWAWMTQKRSRKIAFPHNMTKPQYLPRRRRTRAQTHSRPTTSAGTVSGIFAICMCNLDFAAILWPAIAVILCFAQVLQCVYFDAKVFMLLGCVLLFGLCCCEKGHIGISWLFVTHFHCSDCMLVYFGRCGARSKWQIDPTQKNYCLNRDGLVFLHAWFTSFLLDCCVCVCALTEIVHYIIDGLFLSFSHRNLLPAVARSLLYVSHFFRARPVRCRFDRTGDRQFTSCQRNNQIPGLINNRAGVHHFISHQITDEWNKSSHRNGLSECCVVVQRARTHTHGKDENEMSSNTKIV